MSETLPPGYVDRIAHPTSVKTIYVVRRPTAEEPGVADFRFNPVFSVFDYGTIQPPEATLSRGLEVHPNGSGPGLQLWVDPRYVESGYGWSFPAGDELRIGIGSYDPRFHVKEPTVRLATDDCGCGNRLPRVEQVIGRSSDVFWVDAAGDLKPLSPMALLQAFQNFPTIREWQATQIDSRHIHVKLELLPNAELDFGRVRSRINQGLGRAGFERGDQPEINIETVPRLTPDKNGKFRRVLALVDEAGALGEELRAELAPATWERVHAYTGAMIRSALALTAAAKARERERKSGASMR